MERRPGKHRFQPDQQQSSSEAGQPSTGLPEPQAEQQPHGGGVNRPELHPPQTSEEDQERREKYIESVMRYIEVLQSMDETSFELDLQKTGLLSGLEQAGVIPPRTKPYD